MIQRKQTLFFFQLIFLGIALLFIPSIFIIENSESTSVYLVPIETEVLRSTLGHYVAIGLNFLGLIFASAAILLYKKRQLQLKLCYVLILLWLILTLMMTLCPFVIGDGLQIQINYFTAFIGLFAIFAAYMAARFIKKDIELLKSADRIR